MVVISVSPSGLPGSLSDTPDDAAPAVPAQSTDRPTSRLTCVSTDRWTPRPSAAVFAWASTIARLVCATARLALIPARVLRCGTRVLRCGTQVDGRDGAAPASRGGRGAGGWPGRQRAEGRKAAPAAPTTRLPIARPITRFTTATAIAAAIGSPPSSGTTTAAAVARPVIQPR